MDISSSVISEVSLLQLSQETDSKVLNLRRIKLGSGASVSRDSIQIGCRKKKRIKDILYTYKHCKN